MTFIENLKIEINLHYFQLVLKINLNTLPKFLFH